MLRSSIRCGLQVFALAISVPASAGGMTGEQVVDLRSVRQVALAPDGGRVAYVLRVPRAADDKPGKPWAELWIAVPGSAPRPYVSGSRAVSDVRWRADGKAVLFLLSDGPDADAQVHEIPLDGGEARRLFEHPGSITLERPSPDGRWLAFAAKAQETPEKKKDKEQGRDWKVLDDEPRFRKLWLRDLENGSSRPWIEDDLDVLDLVWAGDGRTAIVRAAKSVRVDDDYMFSKLYRVKVDGAAEPLTDTPGKLGSFVVSPDGRLVAFLGATSQNDPLAQSVFVVPIRGGAARNLTEKLEASASDIAWIDDRTLLVALVQGTRSQLAKLDVESGRRTELDWPRLVVNDLDARGARVALAASSPEHPAEAFALEVGGAPTRLTHSNPGLADVRLAHQAAIEWTGPDGLRITGVLTYPLDWREGRRHPLVLQVHGGPEGVDLDGWTTTALEPVQVLAAAGFFVLQPNYRGSQGRGVTYSKADHDDLGGQEFEDVLAGIDHLAAQGWIDPQRVGTGGWSYGGYLSAWAATRHSARFRASIVCAGLTNWIAFAGTTDIPNEMSLVHWDSWWYDETDLHWQRSPLAHLAQARTPTLIVHGEADDRVHPEQSLELYTALRLKQVKTQMVLYPREPHGLDERAHQLDFIGRVVDWFRTHVGQGGAS
jgi:dipeptidyl aminopeptidase/acylaminoacyl peptidase